MLNQLFLHPSRSAFVSTGTDGVVCLWDIETWSLLRSIKPLEHSVTAVGWHGSTLVVGGKDGGGEANSCGLFSKFVTWDLGRLTLLAGEEEAYNQLGPNTGFARRIWSTGSHVITVSHNRGKIAVEVWTDAE